MNSLHELNGKVLGCWCAPGPCHGDVLVELFETMLIQGVSKEEEKEKKIARKGFDPLSFEL